MEECEGDIFFKFPKFNSLLLTILCIILDIETTASLYSHLLLVFIRKSFTANPRKDSTSLTTDCCRCYTWDTQELLKVLKVANKKPIFPLSMQCHNFSQKDKENLLKVQKRNDNFLMLLILPVENVYQYTVPQIPILKNFHSIVLLALVEFV